MLGRTDFDFEIERFYLIDHSDRPGSLAQLCKLFTTVGASVKDIYHERAWLKSDMFSVQVIHSQICFILIDRLRVTFVFVDSSCFGSSRQRTCWWSTKSYNTTLWTCEILSRYFTISEKKRRHSPQVLFIQHVVKNILQ